MATHIFTVNEKTFKIHLNYMFAGTGKDGSAHQSGALADISGIRKGDNVCFYVMNKGFFGFFKVKDSPFYEGVENQYLHEELGKNLTYRVLIEPYKVFEKAKSEWDVMENPDFIKDHSIYNMQWGWIFKKLNANRGCLSIDSYESMLLENIIEQENRILENVSNYNYEDGIIKRNEKKIYEGITNRKIRNFPTIIKIEEDLRILFTSEGNNNDLLNIVLEPQQNGKINFISNEVICSFSERKLDLVLGTEKQFCLLIELKNKFVFDKSIYNQLKEYSRWISAYKMHYEKIIPILIIREANILPIKKRGKYFKYLSFQDKDLGILSDWYQNLSEEIKQAKLQLKAENISKLDNLKVYIFETDTDNKLVNFKLIE